MEYSEGKFDKEFISRTLSIVHQYDRYVMDSVPLVEQFEVTLLINGLLGLLVLPKENCYSCIPRLPVHRLTEWGMSSDIVKKWGTRPKERDCADDFTVRELIRRMRNSVTHMNFRLNGNGKEIARIQFKDDYGFEASLPVDNLKVFVTHLAQHCLDSNTPPEIC